MNDLAAAQSETISEHDWQACLRVLRTLASDASAIAERAEAERLVARIYKNVRKANRKRSAGTRKEHDRNLVATTGRVYEYRTPAVERVGTAPRQPEEAANSALHARSRFCYICHERYRLVHPFYHLLCPACAERNYEKRLQRSDLSGRVALVTGGRTKIGFATALKLLRDGASMHITTRFPRDAAVRYAAEPDFESWHGRLQIHQSDFRHLPQLLNFIAELQTELPRLDILINNAAQSVRLADEAYLALQQREQVLQLSANQERLVRVNSRKETEYPLAIAQAEFNLAMLQPEPVDLREQHDWTQRLAEVQPRELLEALLINANAPCLFVSGLKRQLENSAFPDRYIVNVTGLDGQFERTKSVLHPHINMSKAALNMLTRTSAADYAESGIYMNSVDVGWITHEAAYSARERARVRGFVPPLDDVDGAARIYDLLIPKHNGQPAFGQLWRNYVPANW